MSRGIFLSTLCRRLAYQPPQISSSALSQGLKNSLNVAPHVQESFRSFHSSPPSSASGIFDLQSVKTAMYPDLYDRSEQILWSKHKSYDIIIDPYIRKEVTENTDEESDFDMTLNLKKKSNKLRTSLTLYRCLAHHYNPEVVRQRAIEAYSVVSEAYSNGDLEPVRQYMTENAYERLRGEVLGRQKVLGGPRSRIDWAMVTPPSLAGTELVHGAIAINPTRQGKLHFAQWTIRFRSQQVMAAYDARGRLVAGDPTKVLDVEDYWVFERPFFKGAVPRRGPTGADWRLVAQLKPADMVRRRNLKAEAQLAEQTAKEDK